jgi:hypothetical protein
MSTLSRQFRKETAVIGIDDIRCDFHWRELRIELATLVHIIPPSHHLDLAKLCDRGYADKNAYF